MENAGLSPSCLTSTYFYDVLGTRIPRMGELHEFFVKLFAPFENSYHSR